MMSEHIKSLASVIAQPSDEEEPLLAALCASAETELRSKLRPNVTPEDCGDAFACAAALLAAAELMPCRPGGVEQFTAGDVTIRTNGGSIETALAMRRQAEKLLAPYAADEGFAFLGVRG